MNTLNSFLDHCKNKRIELSDAQIAVSKALFDISQGCGKTTLISLLYAFDVASKATLESIAEHDGKIPRGDKPYPGQVIMVNKYQQPMSK